MDNILIGTSGYDYKEWKGTFYPQNLKRKDFLKYYSTQFNALELNSTFYNMPDQARLLSFYERSEGKLCFSVKANRLLTHEIDEDWKSAAEIFKNAVNVFHEKNCLSAVLFQFPQSFHYTRENRFYLSDLLKEFEDFPAFIEFRQAEWILESVFDGLKNRGVSAVFCDMPQSDTFFVFPEIYIRMHCRNRNAWYADESEKSTCSESSYSESELDSFIPVIKKAAAENKRMHIFFNNCSDCSGAVNALYLKKSCSIRQSFP